MGRAVVTESGDKLGHCHDVRAELKGNGLEVTALCVGRTAVVEHFGLRGHGRHEEVAWSRVVRIEGKRIVVRDETP